MAAPFFVSADNHDWNLQKPNKTKTPLRIKVLSWFYSVFVDFTSAQSKCFEAKKNLTKPIYPPRQPLPR